MNSLQKIFVFRHADFGFDGRINPLGLSQMQKLADQARRHMEGQRVLILTSPAPRILDSAQALAHALEITEIEQHGELDMGFHSQPKTLAALAKIVERARDFTVIIVVTCLEYSVALPTVFGTDILHVAFDGFLPDRGEGCLIDCMEKTLVCIS